MLNVLTRIFSHIQIYYSPRLLINLIAGSFMYVRTLAKIILRSSGDGCPSAALNLKAFCCARAAKNWFVVYQPYVSQSIGEKDGW